MWHPEPDTSKLRTARPLITSSEASHADSRDRPRPRHPRRPTGTQGAAHRRRNWRRSPIEGRDLAGYDAAAWHASDALQAKQPKEGSVVRYIARKTDKGWVVAFGRLDEKEEKFLIAYEATQGGSPDVFDVKEFDPPREDTGFFRSAARAIDDRPQGLHRALRGRAAALQRRRATRREGAVLGLPRPGPDETRRLAAGRRCSLPDVVGWHQDRRRSGSCTSRSSRTSRRRTRTRSRWRACTRTSWTRHPEDTDVFHVLSRKPAVPEMILTRQFVFEVDPDGGIKYVGKGEEFLKK